MNKGARLLVVSRDQMLLQTRSLLLGAYFQVESAGRVPEAEAAMDKVAFDLVVLCYSLSDEEYAKIVELAQRRNPRPRILTLHGAGNGQPRGGADSECAVERGPYELLKKTAEMVGVSLKSRGRAAQA